MASRSHRNKKTNKQWQVSYLKTSPNLFVHPCCLTRFILGRISLWNESQYWGRDWDDDIEYLYVIQKFINQDLLRSFISCWSQYPGDISLNYVSLVKTLVWDNVNIWVENENCQINGNKLETAKGVPKFYFSAKEQQRHTGQYPYAPRWSSLIAYELHPWQKVP